MEQKVQYRKGRLNFTEIGEYIVTKIAVIVDQTRKLRLNRERQALLFAKSRGLNVPRVLDYYLDKEDREVLVIEKIKGRKLPFKETKFNSAKMREVGKEMTKLSSASVKFGWPDSKNFYGEYPQWGAFLCAFVSIYGSRLIDTGILPLVIIERLLYFLEKVNLDIKKPSLIHRDLKPDNILATPNGQIFIIDWENALLGDSLFDVASYGANYGHDRLWEGLADGFNATVNSNKYRLYELVALIGVIDFYRKQELNYSKKMQYLMGLIKNLQLV